MKGWSEDSYPQRRSGFRCISIPHECFASRPIDFVCPDPWREWVSPAPVLVFCLLACRYIHWFVATVQIDDRDTSLTCLFILYQAFLFFFHRSHRKDISPFREMRELLKHVLAYLSNLIISNLHISGTYVSFFSILHNSKLNLLSKKISRK